MDSDDFRDDQWARILPLIPDGSEGKCGPRTDNRRFINALLWMARSGVRWKDLPSDLGDFQTVKRRYYRWLGRGLIDRLFEELGRDADRKWLMLDSTIVPAHQHAAGVPKKKGARKPSDWAAQGVVSRRNLLSQPLL